MFNNGNVLVFYIHREKINVKIVFSFHDNGSEMIVLYKAIKSEVVSAYEICATHDIKHCQWSFSLQCSMWVALALKSFTLAIRVQKSVHEKVVTGSDNWKATSKKFGDD